MGNHDAGAAMVQAAEALIAVREQTSQSAVEILETACRPWLHVGDPEFDEAHYPNHPFGELLKEVFCPDFDVTTPTDDNDQDGWYKLEDQWCDRVLIPFSNWRDQQAKAALQNDQ